MQSPLRTRLSRRGILMSLAGAALGVVGFAYPGLASVLSTERSRERPASSPVTSGLIDPTFTSGEVVDKTADSLLLQSVEGSRLVRIQAETRSGRSSTFRSTASSSVCG